MTFALSTFPLRQWRALQDQLWQDRTAELLLPPAPGGEPALRRMIAEEICAPAGLEVEPRQLLIAPDAQAALRLIAAVETAMRCDGAPAAPEDQVVHLWRLGELLFPAFPLAVVAAPKPLLPVFEAQIDFMPVGPPRSDQLLLARFIETGGLAAHLRRLRPQAPHTLMTIRPANRLSI